MSKKAVMYCCVTDSYQSGAFRAFMGMVQGMAATDRRVEVVLPVRGEMSEKLESLGIKVHYIPMTKVRRAVGTGYRGKYIFDFFKIVPKLISLFRKRKVGIVHVNQTIELQPLIAAWLCPGIKLVVHCHGTVMTPRWLGRLISGTNYIISDRMVLVSRGLAETCFTKDKLRTNKLHVVKSALALDTADFDHKKYGNGLVRDKKRELTGDETCFVVGMVSKFVRFKGHDTLVEIAGIIKEKEPDLNIKYIVVGGKMAGDEEYFAKVEEMIKKLGLEDRFHMVGARRNVADYTSMFDILVHIPTEFDSFPTVILEAMALEKPVIAHRLGGIPEQVVDGKTGWLFDIGANEKIAVQIIKSYEDRNSLKQMGKDARVFLEESFSVEGYPEKLDKIYEGL